MLLSVPQAFDTEVTSPNVTEQELLKRSLTVRASKQQSTLREDVAAPQHIRIVFHLNSRSGLDWHQPHGQVKLAETFLMQSLQGFLRYSPLGGPSHTQL